MTECEMAPDGELRKIVARSAERWKGVLALLAEAEKLERA